jgi:hypothetical protein
MRFRKLRIAWSIGCGIACVLLIVLWVGGYDGDKSLYRITGRKGVTVYVSPKGIILSGCRYGDLNDWSFIKSGPELSIMQSGEHRLWTWTNWSIRLPYWTLTLALSALAVIPWLPWSNRFSLRTLLIAVTLVAAVLGLICYTIG